MCTEAVCGLQPAEPSWPQLGQELVKRLQAFGPDGVQPPGALAVGSHQAGLLEDLQVLGDRLLGDVDPLGDLADRARRDADQAQDFLPARLCEGFQHSFGAHHARLLPPANTSPNL
jgi:hypothetical protein